MNELIHFPDIKQSTKTINRFISCSISERILYTAFLFAIGVGYLVALANMYYTYENNDGSPGFSVEDVIVKYHGSQDHSRLATAINGIMAPNLNSLEDKEAILKWIQNGAPEKGYANSIAPILSRDCVTCHTPSINPSLPNLTEYKTVAALAQMGGTPLTTLLRIAHIHLFGISILLVFVGKIFLLCDMNKTVKRVMVGLPFVAMVVDIASWFATRINADFAYVIVASGTVMGVSIAIQILTSIYQMWVYPKHKYSMQPVYE